MSQQQHHQSPTPGIKRLLVISSAVAYVLFLGIPVWWHTTSLHRPPLPHEAMQHVSAQAAAAATSSSSAAFLPVALRVVAVLPAGQQPSQALAAALHGSLSAAVAGSRPTQAVRLSVTFSAADGSGCQHHPEAADACWTDWSSTAPLPPTSGSTPSQQQQLDDWLSAASQAVGDGDSLPGHYSLFLLPNDRQPDTAGPSTVFVGRHRHAWLLYDPAAAAAQAELLLSHLQQQASAAAVKALACCFALHAGPDGLAAAGSLPISPAGHTHLSLALLNADPAAGPHFSWDMEQWEARYLAPVAASLAPVAALSMESQVLQYTAARLQGQWSDKHGAFVVKGSQLPFFIDSEWSLESGRAVTPLEGTGSGSSSCGSSGGNTPSSVPSSAAATLVEPHVLQFVVYVPPRSHRPLQLLGRKGRIRDSNSYVMPAWGGLMVLNPDDGDAGNSSAASSPATPAAAVLTHEQHQHIAAVLIAQLQALFGLAASAEAADPPAPTAGASPRIVQLPAGRLGFSSWQVDALLRQRAGHDVREASRVLGALSTLVEELPNLEMPDVIGEQVAQALSDISSAWQHTAAGNYTAAAAAATAAHAAAEAAFSHPAVLAQFNFPESHKLGVYMPLFLPLCVPLIQGLMGQLLHYKQRRRACMIQRHSSQ